MVREGTDLREVTGSGRSRRHPRSRGHKGRVAALVGGQATNEEAFLLQRLLREGLDSHDIECRSASGTVELGVARSAGRHRRCRRRSRTSSSRTPSSSSEPSRWTTPRSSICGSARACAATASSSRSRRPARARWTPNATLSVRYAPGDGDRVPGCSGGCSFDAASRTTARTTVRRLTDLATLLRDGGSDVVILWGESLPPEALPSAAANRRAAGAVRARRRRAARDPGRRQHPRGPRGRSAAERRARLLGAARVGRGVAEIAKAAASGEIASLYLLQVDPLRELADREAWRAALGGAFLVVAHASVLSEGLAKYADVDLPGRVERREGRHRRPSRRAAAAPARRDQAPRRGPRRAGQVIADVARRVGHDLGALTSPMAFEQLTEAVPFYAGLTLEQIGGRGRALAGDRARGSSSGGRRRHGRCCWQPRQRPAGTGERPSPPTDICGSEPTARSGPPPRSRSRRRCSSPSPSRSSNFARGRRAARHRRRRGRRGGPERDAAVRTGRRPDRRAERDRVPGCRDRQGLGQRPDRAAGGGFKA